MSLPDDYHTTREDIILLEHMDAMTDQDDFLKLLADILHRINRRLLHIERNLGGGQ